MSSKIWGSLKAHYDNNPSMHEWTRRVYVAGCVIASPMCVSRVWPVRSSCSSGCWTATPSQRQSQRCVSGARGPSAPRLFTVHHPELPELSNSSTPPAFTKAPSRESKRGHLPHPPPPIPLSPHFYLCFPLLNLILSSFQRSLSITNCLGSLREMKDCFVFEWTDFRS